MDLYDFNYAMYQANQLYDTTFTNVDDFAELGLVAWEEIGNKHTQLFRYIGHPDESGIIQLPCNCDIIEAVVAPHEDWSYTSNKTNGGDYKSEWIEEWIEARKIERHPYYASGHYVHFEELPGKYIHLLEPAPIVLIIYKGVILDDDDLPKISHAESLAVSAFVAYISKFKEALKTSNPQLSGFADKLELKWITYKRQAKNPTHITQNDMDNIANAKSRWPGKSYGKSYKPLLK